MASLSGKLSLDTSEFNKALDQAGKQIEAFSAELRSVGTSLTASLTAPLAAVGAGAVMAASKMETLETALETMLGSGEKAQAMLSDLADFTAKTPFQLEGVGQSARVLLSFGFEAENVTDQLKTLGDVASGAGSDITEITNIFGKASANGKVYNETLNQLAERGIPIFKVLEEQLGMTTEEVIKLSSSGKLGFEEIEKAFASMTAEGGIFFNAMEKQSTTVAGLFSTLKDNVNLAAASLGNAIIEAVDLRGIISDLTGAIQGIVSWFNNLSVETQQQIILFAGLAAAIGPVLVAVGALAPAISTAIGILTGIGPAIAVAIAAFELLRQNWEEVVAFFTSGGGSALVDGFKSIFNNIADIVVTAVGYIQSLWETFGQDLINIGSTVFSTITDIFGQAFQIIGSLLGTFSSLFRGDWDGLWNGLVETFQRFVNLIVSQFQGALNVLVEGGTLLAKIFGVDVTEGAQKAIDKINEVAESLKFTVLETEAGGASFDYFGNAVEFATEKLKAFQNVISGGVGGESPNNLGGGTEALQGQGLGIQDPNDIIPINDDVLDKMVANNNAFINNMRALEASAAEITNALQSSVQRGMTNVIGGLANALGSGENLFGAFLGSMGSFMQELGGQMIAIGVAQTGLAAALTAGPFGGAAAIAAGAALVAAGAAFNAMASSGGETYGGSSPARTETGSATSPTMNDIDMGRTDRMFTITGQLVADGDQLVAVIDENNRKTGRDR